MSSLEGNAVAASVAYRLSDACFIYPITPSSPMGQYADVWAQTGKKNVFSSVPVIHQLQSEGGVSGALHGAAVTGALTSTFTCSQGLLLMIPNMYKLAGELIPTVFHVAARAVASNAMNIYCDHSDVMACRQTGFCMLHSMIVQESQDFAAIAHLASVKGCLPFLHWFDGMRTSHEINKVIPVEDDVLAELFDFEALSDWRNTRVLNNERPCVIGGVCGLDMHWQIREASQPLWDKIPEIVQGLFDAFAQKTGRQYHLFDYVGHPEAEDVVVMLGSGATAMEEVVTYLNDKGGKVGLLKVRLFRPWSNEHFLKAIPKTVKRMAVLDRTLELGAPGEPCFLSVMASLMTCPERVIEMCGGSYGVGGKELSPSNGLSVFKNMKAENPKEKFTVGITDDVNHLSLDDHEVINTMPDGTRQCIFYALGADGTVGANKNAISIIGDNTDLHVQGYFCYDAKKTGGFTISHLRFGPKPVHGAYEITQAGFVACHQASLLAKMDVLERLDVGGTFVLNCPWGRDGFEKKASGDLLKKLCEKKAKVFVIDADALAEKVGLTGRINMVMNTAFFKLSNVLPMEHAIPLLKKAVEKTYGRIGKAVVEKNMAAIDSALENLQEVTVKPEWASLKATEVIPKVNNPFVDDVITPTLRLHGGDLPSSLFKDVVGGIMPVHTSRYEKRKVTNSIPRWDEKKCIQCNQCAGSCPHAVIRPFVLSAEEIKADKMGIVTTGLKGVKGAKDMGYHIQVSPYDCVGCGACVNVCPKGCLSFESYDDEKLKEENARWDACLALPDRSDLFNPQTFKGALFREPMIEFTAACGGCVEVPHAKLLTQLFGQDLIVANACGCSMVWGGYHPTSPWVRSRKTGRGPVYCGTLFEDAAENGIGMAVSVIKRRSRLVDDVKKAVENPPKDAAWASLEPTLKEWLDVVSDRTKCDVLYEKVKVVAASLTPSTPIVRCILESLDLMIKRVVWVIGGDGWAFDIGFGGLEHVLSMNVDLNVLVLNTEVYSNTGGQRSKATPRGAVAGFASKGSRTRQKDLGVLVMQGGACYVASVAVGANPNQYTKALIEAESYPGASLVMAYCPCIAHGLDKGQGTSPSHQKLAVETGYWPLYRFNPKNPKPLTIDSKISRPLEEFLSTETRFKSLREAEPELAKELQDGLEKDVVLKNSMLQDLKMMLEKKA